MQAFPESGSRGKQSPTLSDLGRGWEGAGLAAVVEEG